MNEGQNLDVLGDWCVYDVVIVGACYLWRHYKQFKPRGICNGYFSATRGYVAYSPRAQPEVNESHIHKVS